jgi:hypothetical protein
MTKKEWSMAKGEKLAIKTLSIRSFWAGAEREKKVC